MLFSSKKFLSSLYTPDSTTPILNHSPSESIETCEIISPTEKKKIKKIK